MTVAVSFQVPCVPVAQPRQRHRMMVGKGGRSFVTNFTPARHPVNAYKAALQLAASQVHNGPPLEGPLSLVLIFVLPRPGRLIWKSRPMPRAWHASKPDAENCAKSTMDALTGLLFRDDSQIAQLVCRKWIASGDEAPHVEVSVKQLEEVKPEEPEQSLWE